MRGRVFDKKDQARQTEWVLRAVSKLLVYNLSHLINHVTMSYSHIYLYSPLSPATVAQDDNPALLLQFMLSELVQAVQASEKEDPLDFVFTSPACFFPYDWSNEVGCLNKLSEHAQLLEWAFPNLEQATSAFHDCLSAIFGMIASRRKMKQEISPEDLLEDLRALYRHLIPFAIQCRKSESFVLFLLQNGEEISKLAFPETLSHLLKRIFPEGLQAISHLLKHEYRQRGFDALLPEIERLLSLYDA